MKTTHPDTLTSEQKIEALERQLAESREQIKQKDALITEMDAHITELDALHMDADWRSLLVADSARLDHAVQNAEELRNFIIAWFASGEELSVTDRRRLLGSGVRRLGFIVKVAEMMQINPELTPSFVNREHYLQTIAHIEAARNLSAILTQAARLASDVLLIYSDEAYRMALSYYVSVRDAANRRIPGARELFRILQAFFRRGRRTDEEPTEEEIMRDAKALLRHKKDGEVIIKNVSGHATEGVHEAIDQTYKPKAAFKDTEEGEIEG